MNCNSKNHKQKVAKIHQNEETKGFKQRGTRDEFNKAFFILNQP